MVKASHIRSVMVGLGLSVVGLTQGCFAYGGYAYPATYVTYGYQTTYQPNTVYYQGGHYQGVYYRPGYYRQNAPFIVQARPTVVVQQQPTVVVQPQMARPPATVVYPNGNSNPTVIVR